MTTGNDKKTSERAKLPKPLTTRRHDLRSLEYMPVHVRELFGSVAWATADERPELAFYMVNLWASAWHQVPAASLENNDAILRQAAQCKREVWPQVRDAALRGFVECRDGRLYHRALSKMARHASDLHEKRREAGKAGANARYQKKKPGSDRIATAEQSHSRRMPNRNRNENSNSGSNPENYNPVDRSLVLDGFPQKSEKPHLPPNETASPSLFNENEVDTTAQLREALRLAVAAYNDAADACAWPRCDKLTTARGKSLKARLRDLSRDGRLSTGLEGWRSAMRRAAASKFLRGESPNSNPKHANWKPTIDFFLSETKFARLLEGGYDDRNGSNDRRHDEPSSNLQRGLRAIFDDGDGSR
jgi:hypothetical protein